MDLGVNRFTGTLSPSLSQLTALGYLALNSNLFTGTVPSEFSVFSALS